MREGDGYRGWPEHAPFDGIIVTAAPERIPQPLLDQLVAGRPYGHPRSAASSRSSRSSRKGRDGRITEKDIIPVRFVPMTGEIENEKTRRSRRRESGGSGWTLSNRGQVMSLWGQVWTLSNRGQVCPPLQKEARLRGPKDFLLR